ncbi:hypothetical protein Trydic_g9685 [Trypoxylus dichotomus]
MWCHKVGLTFALLLCIHLGSSFPEEEEATTASVTHSIEAINIVGISCSAGYTYVNGQCIREFKSVFNQEEDV